MVADVSMTPALQTLVAASQNVRGISYSKKLESFVQGIERNSANMTDSQFGDVLMQLGIRVPSDATREQMSFLLQDWQSKKQLPSNSALITPSETRSKARTARESSAINQFRFMT